MLCRMRYSGKEGISVNQFIASAAAEKMSSVLTVDFLRREAIAGRREDFERFLAAVPDTPPLPGDEGESGFFRSTAQAESAPASPGETRDRGRSPGRP